MGSASPPGGRSTYGLLVDEPNLAVDSALIEALPDLEPAEQATALDTLITRGRDRGLLGIVGRFSKLDSSLQSLILARAGGLYAGVRLAVTQASATSEMRASAIDLIRRSGDCRLAYLLAAALGATAADPKTREQAGTSLRDLTAHLLVRREQCHTEGGDLQRLRQDEDYLSRALARAIECWELHFRTEVLAAAMWLPERLADTLLSTAASARSNLGRAILEQMGTLTDPRLAGFALRALQSAELRAETVRRIGACRHNGFMRGLIREAWLLGDPQVARECHRIRDLAWLAGGLGSALDDWEWSEPRAEGLARLVDACGLAADAKTGVYRQLLDSSSEHLREAAFWRVAGQRSDTAARLLGDLARRQSGDADHLAAAAVRELKRRGHDPLPSTRGGSESSLTVDTNDFDTLWTRFDSLAGTDRAAAGPSDRGGSGPAAVGPDTIARLANKLASAEPTDRVKALRMVRYLGVARSLDEAVYRLANDRNEVVRSAAVALLSELDSPTARRIARRSMDDPDTRVQANAIEALERLSAFDRSEQVRSKLSAPHHRVRAAAVAALLRMEMPQAAETLLEMLDDGAAPQRIAALWVIERLHLSSLFDRLVRIAKHDPDGRVRQRAARLVRSVVGQAAWPGRSQGAEVKA